MNYFSAVQEGKARVKRAVELLQEIAGPSYPVFFLKEGREVWTPVGEETLYSMVEGKNSTAALVICDGEGNSKAMSGWFEAQEARRFAASFESRGLQQYVGTVQLPT